MSDAKDAARWRKIRRLTTIKIDQLSRKERAAWDRLIRGGWYTDDIDALIDALPSHLEAREKGKG